MGRASDSGDRRRLESGWYLKGYGVRLLVLPFMKENWKQKYKELSNIINQYLLAKPRSVKNVGEFLNSHGWIEIEVKSNKRWKSPDNSQLYMIKEAAHLIREKMREEMAILSGNGSIIGKP